MNNSSLPMLPSNWHWLPLKSLVDKTRGISYGIVQPGEEDPSGVPVIRVNNLQNGRVATDEVKRVSREIEAKYQRTRLRGGELLISLVGSLGSTAIATDEFVGWNVARAIGVIPLLSDVNTRWVQYSLAAPWSQRYISDRANTTVQATFNLGDLAELPIPRPPKPIEDEIAHILGSLDDKIDLNRRMNATLEAMARALFKSWFVDFDPVRAKGEGRQPDGIDADTAALFPASFEDSALGPIPAGWRIMPLDQIADFLNGLALQKFPPEGDEWLPVIKIRELRQGFADESSNQASTRIKLDYIIENGDVIFSWSGSLLLDIWCGGRGALNQHLFKVTSTKFPKWFFFHWVQYHLAQFIEIAANKATTMGHIQRHHLAEAVCIVPPDNLLVKMSEIIQPFFDAVIQNRLQSQTLATTRDALLPRLMSGEVRV